METPMKTPLVMVSATLTVAIILVAGFLIATQARGQTAEPPRVRCVATKTMTVCETGHDHLWKMKNAPAAINAKPIA
ncbi:hypothetical protein HMPREF9696_02306 [Afipia clevelandensis ATCC 49720]|uniref:Uncharacterized protein n=2 Tax=Afipia clevelandensis TaxID=1034 RepID=K8P1Y8_9BRAD|nr:hypothetical protein HMPREF9696_02306 [Afipia clevelandensis ATCC 49720]